MAQSVGGTYIGAAALRENVYQNAKQSNESKDNIRGQGKDETVPRKKGWFVGCCSWFTSCCSWFTSWRPKFKLKIRQKSRERRQFRWKKIETEPDYS